MTNSISGILSLPSSWSLENFREAMRVTDFWNSLGNSLFITLVTVALSIVIHSMIGYAIGRNKAHSKGIIWCTYTLSAGCLFRLRFL